MRARLLATVVLGASVCLATLDKRSAHAESDATWYDDVRSVVEALVRKKAAVGLGAYLRDNRPELCFYMAGSLERLGSGYLGGVPRALKEDATVLLADAVWWVASHGDTNKPLRKLLADLFSDSGGENTLRSTYTEQVTSAANAAGNRDNDVVPCSQRWWSRLDHPPRSLLAANCSRTDSSPPSLACRLGWAVQFALKKRYALAAAEAVDGTIDWLIKDGELGATSITDSESLRKHLRRWIFSPEAAAEQLETLTDAVAEQSLRRATAGVSVAAAGQEDCNDEPESIVLEDVDLSSPKLLCYALDWRERVMAYRNVSISIGDRSVVLSMRELGRWGASVVAPASEAVLPTAIDLKQRFESLPEVAQAVAAASKKREDQREKARQEQERITKELKEEEQNLQSETDETDRQRLLDEIRALQDRLSEVGAALDALKADGTASGWTAAWNAAEAAAPGNRGSNGKGCKKTAAFVMTVGKRSLTVQVNKRGHIVDCGSGLAQLVHEIDKRLFHLNHVKWRVEKWASSLLVIGVLKDDYRVERQEHVKTVAAYVAKLQDALGRVRRIHEAAQRDGASVTALVMLIDPLLGLVEELASEKDDVENPAASEDVKKRVAKLRDLLDRPFVEFVVGIVQRRDLREAGLLFMEASLGDDGGLSELDKAKRRFFTSFAAYVLETAEAGLDSDSLARDAFRAAALDLLSELDHEGYPTQSGQARYLGVSKEAPIENGEPVDRSKGAYVSEFFWGALVPQLSLRYSVNRDYRNETTPDGSRVIVTAPFLRLLQFPFSQYTGLQLYLGDFVAWASEIALRKRGKYLGQKRLLLWDSLLRPQADVWLGLPQVSRSLAVSAGISTRFLRVHERDEDTFEYAWDWDSPSLEVSLGVLLFW